MNKVYVDLSENGKRIEIYFRFDQETYRAVKSVTGSTFVDKTKGGPYWWAPLDFATAQELRQACGDSLVVGDKLNAWARAEKNKANQLQMLSSADDADLKRVPKAMPELHEWMRGYQKSGAAFIAAADASLIADQPGLGKTVQVIAGIYEAGLAEGAHLIIAPIVSLQSVWQRELERWQENPVWVPTGNREQREAVVEDFYNYITNVDGSGWLVVNPQMVAFRREAPKCDECGTEMNKLRGESYQCETCFGLGKAKLVSAFPRISEISWRTMTIDECHKNAIRNPKTLTAQAMFKLEAEKRIAMSGTPIANKPIDLWGVLHFLHPDKFSSKWRWAYQWLEVTDNGYGKVIGNLLEHKKEDFFRSLAPYVLRRTRDEVFPELPKEQPIDLWVEMTPGQEKQYVNFARDAELRIDEEDLTATEVLTEYLRLKQFAIAKQEMRDSKPFPTFDSAKLAAVEEVLEERGIFDGDGTEKVVIFSQWERVVDMVIAWLKTKKVEALKLTGRENRKPKLSKEIQDRFQDPDGPRVIVMTTETGGVSITLDRANSCILMDETWLASDDEQAISRLRPQSPSRMDRPEEHVFAYYIRTKGTIDEYIFEMVYEKGMTAEEILDKRRKVKLY